MTASSTAQAFLYRVVTANERLEVLEEEGLLERPLGSAKDEAPGDSVLGDFGVQVRLEAQRMGTAYELLYCLENSVRELIESTLIESLGAGAWWEEGVAEEVRRSAEERAQDDERTPWHGPRGDSPLVYVDFPQLAEIISGNWEAFRDLLGDKTWVANYFREMNRTRRALAHTGSLSQQDLAWMNMRVRQWLMVVG